MRIDYYINDRKYFEHMISELKTSKNEKEELIKSLNSKDLNVVYSLIEKTNGLYYELRDAETNEKININDLNGYEKSYTNMCFNHFNGKNDKEIKEHCIDYTVIEN